MEFEVLVPVSTVARRIQRLKTPIFYRRGRKLKPGFRGHKYWAISLWVHRRGSKVERCTHQTDKFLISHFRSFWADIPDLYCLHDLEDSTGRGLYYTALTQHVCRVGPVLYGSYTTYHHSKCRFEVIR